MAALGTAAIGLPASVEARRGYWLPDEAHSHERTFMQWPVNRTVYPDTAFLEILQQTIADLANTIATFEPVVMLMAREHARTARRFLSRDVEIWDIPTDDLWCRDSGPTFVIDDQGNLAVAHIQFNGWGNKQVHGNDGRIAARVAQVLDLPILETGLVGEAGGVEQDGDGTLIAHESSWVNPNRNAASKAVIEERLLKALGAEKMIWAPGIKDADITDYHIDALLRFTRPGHVLIQLPGDVDASDPWTASAFETLDILKNSTDARGRKLSIVAIADPYQTRIDAEDFVASYVNYYVCNGAVITAAFGDPEADARAFRALQTLYPDREIVALNVDAIGEVGGGIHCATQQQPKI